MMVVCLGKEHNDKALLVLLSSYFLVHLSKNIQDSILHFYGSEIMKTSTVLCTYYIEFGKHIELQHIKLKKKNPNLNSQKMINLLFYVFIMLFIKITMN